MKNLHINIKKWLLTTIILAVGFNSIVNAFNTINNAQFDTTNRHQFESDAFKICLFSKHLQWLSCVELAKTAKEVGFDGIDLTVRPGGHVLPENVEIDLPKAVQVIRNAGLEIFMITTAIDDADDPLTERILKTASALGIRYYRFNAFYYNPKKSITENLEIIQHRMEKLAKLNQKFKIIGEYQIHSMIYDPGVFHGFYFGSTIWDLYMVLKNINSPWVCCQYDIGHATIECTRSWEFGLELLTPYIKSLQIKDFAFEKKDGLWNIAGRPVGEGMVDFKRFFEAVYQRKISGPITFYFMDNIGNPKDGIKLEQMKKELTALKQYMTSAGLKISRE